MNNKVLHYGLLNAAVNDFVIRYQQYGISLMSAAVAFFYCQKQFGIVFLRNVLAVVFNY